MNKSKRYLCAAVATLIAGFIFHVCYTNGTLVLSRNAVTNATIYGVIMVIFLGLAVSLVFLSYLHRNESILRAVLYTVGIAGVFMVLLYVFMLFIGLASM